MSSRVYDPASGEGRAQHAVPLPANGADRMRRRKQLIGEFLADAGGAAELVDGPEDFEAEARLD